MNDDVIVPAYLLESGSDNSIDMYSDLSDHDDYTDNSEQEEQEETELTNDNSTLELLLSDIYTELTDIHAEIVTLDNSINNVALCVQQFANVFVEFFVVVVIMVLIKTVFDSLLHFFK